jgi:hypothetical protein
MGYGGGNKELSLLPARSQRLWSQTFQTAADSPRPAAAGRVDSANGNMYSDNFCFCQEKVDREINDRQITALIAIGVDQVILSPSGPPPHPNLLPVHGEKGRRRPTAAHS